MPAEVLEASPATSRTLEPHVIVLGRIASATFEEIVRHRQERTGENAQRARQAVLEVFQSGGLLAAQQAEGIVT